VPSRRSLAVASGRDLGLTVAFAVAALGLGVGAEVVAGAPQGLALALLDLAVGISLLAFGAVARMRRPESRTGIWLMVAGLAWFAGTLAGPFVYLHRGLLVLLILAYPSGRLARRSLVTLVVAVAMLDSAIVPLAHDDRLTLAVAVLLVAAALYSFGRSGGVARPAAVPGLLAALALASILCVGAGLRLAGSGSERPVLWAYDLVIVALVIVLFVDLLRARWSESVLRGLIAALSFLEGSPTLRDRLARALGDPTLVVGLWDAEAQEYVDESGTPVEPPPGGSGRIVTRIDDESDRLALLVHDEAAVTDTQLVAPLAAVARTALANASLELKVEQRTREIEASRRRLVEAADGERRALQQTLARGPERRLRQVSQLLTHSAATDGGAASQAIKKLVEAAIGELNELAHGVRPAELEGGLEAALPALAARSPLDVSVLVRTERLPEAIEAAAYFVCSEALTNSAKHARAASARVEAVRDKNRLRLSVSDDGVGGADADGAGLRGLADRVEALGGRLRLESPAGAGTRVLAEMPCN
jgi:signal transduction histidine kinase